MVALNLALTHLEKKGPSSSTQQGDDQDNSDRGPAYHKLEFPRFDGKGDPLAWLSRCDQYFRIHHTPDDKKVAYTSFHLLEDAQLCYHRLELNGGAPTWRNFMQLINTRFGPPLTDCPLGEITLLKRTGTVNDYATRIATLACRAEGLMEPQQIQLFTVGLGEPLHTDMVLQCPTTLDEAIMYACAYEQRNTVVTTSPRPSSKPVARSSAASSVPPTSAPSTQAAPSSKKLSPPEIAEHRLKKICFHCNEPYSLDHWQQCKQLFMIVVAYNDYEDAVAATTEEPVISVSALTSIHPRAARTMQVVVDRGGCPADRPPRLGVYTTSSMTAQRSRLGST